MLRVALHFYCLTLVAYPLKWEKRIRKRNRTDVHDYYIYCVSFKNDETYDREHKIYFKCDY